MHDASSRRAWQVVDDPEAALALIDLDRRRFLIPFFGRERTLSQAAAELGLRPNSLLYQVRRLLALGLLEVAREEPRAGRAIRHYRTTADGFFVPYAVTPAETLEVLLAELDAHYQKQLVHNLAEAALDSTTDLHTWGVRMTRDASGEVATTLAPSPETPLSAQSLPPDLPPMLSVWVPALLDPDEARALQQELIAVASRYAARKTGARYILRLAMAPWTDPA